MDATTKSYSPFFSIVIPVYETASYVSECLDSILHQPFSDFEIICVYDESSDGSFSVLEKIADTDSRIYVITGRGQGLSAARNDGMKIARGKYILFCDSDDFYVADAFSVMAKKITSVHADIFVFGSYVVQDNADTPFVYKEMLCTRDVVYEPFSQDAIFKELGARPFVWRNCYERNFLSENELLFEEDIKVGEDHVFQMYAFPLAKKIVFMSCRLYCYRWNRQGSLQNKLETPDAARLYGHIHMIQKVFGKWNSNGTMRGMERKFTEWAIDLVYIEMVRLHGIMKDTSSIRNLKIEVFEKLCSIIPSPYFKQIGIVAKYRLRRMRHADIKSSYSRFEWRVRNLIVLISQHGLRHTAYLIHDAFASKNTIFAEACYA